MCDEVFNIAKILKYDGHQHRLASMISNFFNKKRAHKFAGSGIKNENIPNKEPAEELNKPIIRMF